MSGLQHPKGTHLCAVHHVRIRISFHCVSCCLINFGCRASGRLRFQNQGKEMCRKYSYHAVEPQLNPPQQLHNDIMDSSAGRRRSSTRLANLELEISQSQCQLQISFWTFGRLGVFVLGQVGLPNQHRVFRIARVPQIITGRQQVSTRSRT